MAEIVRRRTIETDADGRDYFEPAILKCDCGTLVRLTSNTNTCPSYSNCGQDYNLFGQKVNGSLESIDSAFAGEEW